MGGHISSLCRSCGTVICLSASSPSQSQNPGLPIIGNPMHGVSTQKVQPPSPAAPTAAPPLPAASTPVLVTFGMITDGLRGFVAHESSSADPHDHISDDVTFCPSPTGQLAKVLRLAAKASQADLDDAAALLDHTIIGRYLRSLGRTLTHDATCVAARPFVMLPAVDTSAELFINDHLGNVALRLVNDRYAGASTGHSYVIMGPRACGKTVALKRFALTATLRFPKLCVLHLCAQHIVSVSWKSICAFAIKTMLGAGAQGVPEVSSFVELCAFLKRADRYCMLVVDDLEYLYTVEPQYTWINKVLQDLAAFSSSENGRTSFVGCSSTYLAFALVKGAGAVQPNLRCALFPAFKNVNPPTMNGSKLCPEWIISTSPVDTIALQPFFLSPDIPVALQRVITFVIGNSVRTLNQRELSSDLVQAPSHSISLFSSAPTDYTSKLVHVFPQTVAFISGAYRRMYDKNKDLLQRCLMHPISGPSSKVIELSSLDATFIGQTDWQRDFKPLTAKDVADICKEEVSPPVVEFGLQQEIVAVLVLDVALLVAVYNGGVRNERNVKLYPKSMLTLLLEAQALASFQHAQRK